MSHVEWNHAGEGEFVHLYFDGSLRYFIVSANAHDDVLEAKSMSSCSRCGAALLDDEPQAWFDFASAWYGSFALCKDCLAEAKVKFPDWEFDECVPSESPTSGTFDCDPSQELWEWLGAKPGDAY